MNEDEFQQALADARRGDERAFEVLWRTCNPRLVRVLYGLGGGQDADDLASAVWVDVVRSLVQFSGNEDAFRGWLFTIARRRVIDLRRHDARRPHESLSGAEDRAGGAVDPAMVVVDEAATAEALALIGTLPSDQAEVVLLRVVAGLDVAQVAAIIGRKPGTVRVLAHRGLRRLAVELAKRTDVPGSDEGVTP